MDSPELSVSEHGRNAVIDSMLLFLVPVFLCGWIGLRDGAV